MLKMCLEVAIKDKTAFCFMAKYANAYNMTLENRPNMSKEEMKGRE